MSDWSPKSAWDRMMRTLEGWMDGDAEVDEASMLFYLLFVLPVLLALVLQVRR
jgi:hypothetical protein